MIDLAEHGQEVPVSLRDVAARQRISKRYLEQVAAGLRNAALISASPGHGGGYTLRRPPHEIQTLEIITAAIGPLEIVRCVSAPQLCTRARSCPSRKMWVRVHELINEELKSTPLSQLKDGCRAMFGDTSVGSTPCTSVPK